MKLTVDQLVYKKVKRHKKGTLLFIEDFDDLGKGPAVRQAMSRWASRGLLIRIAKGIYLYPRMHRVLGPLMPSAEMVARAVARRDMAKLIPSGAFALNRLGLTTQVPLKLVYVTNGSPRLLKVGKSTIRFKFAPPKIFAVRNPRLQLVIQALKELGQGQVSSTHRKKILDILRNENPAQIRRDMKCAPRWMRLLISEALE